jgi:hypothetical protein
MIDVEAQKTFEQELESYQLRVKARLEGSLSDAPWPQPPTPPPAMADSRDPGLPMSFASTQLPSYMNAPSGADLRAYATLDYDGTSQSVVKGFESSWQEGDDGKQTSKLPFTIKKG